MEINSATELEDKVKTIQQLLATVAWQRIQELEILEILIEEAHDLATRVNP